MSTTTLLKADCADCASRVRKFALAGTVDTADWHCSAELGGGAMHFACSPPDTRSPRFNRSHMHVRVEFPHRVMATFRRIPAAAGVPLHTLTAQFGSASMQTPGRVCRRGCRRVSNE